MEIRFENERELTEAILKTDIDVYTFGVLFLDRFGIVLNKTSQNRLLDAQEKRKLANTEFTDWKVRQRRVFKVEDIAEVYPLMSIKDAKDQLTHQIGYAKRGTIWYNDFRYYDGEHYFNEDGCRTVTYLLYTKGFYDKDTLDDMRRTLGIADAE